MSVQIPDNGCLMKLDKKSDLVQNMNYILISKSSIRMLHIEASRNYKTLKNGGSPLDKQYKK